MIKVLFFGQLKDQLGVNDIEVYSDHHMTVSQLLDNMALSHPQWAQELNSETLLVAVNQVMAQADTMVSESSEVAFFPPVTGG